MPAAVRRSSTASVMRRSGRAFIWVLSVPCALLFSTCEPSRRDAHHSVQLHEALGVADSAAAFSDRVQFQAVPAPPKERRKVSRAKLPRPIGGRVGAARVFLVDVS